MTEQWCHQHLDSTALDGGSLYEREDEADTNSTVFVKYNRMLHGRKASHKRETLTIDFLKKYIHYAKHRIQPDLTDEVTLLAESIFSLILSVRLLVPCLLLHSFSPLLRFSHMHLLIVLCCFDLEKYHEQASEEIATAYAELRSASSTAKVHVSSL